MKLTANELRIGNYVWYGDGELKIDINVLYDIDVYNALGTEGIPLTEEWLLKFGFENEGLHGNRFVHNKLIGDGNRFIIETDFILLYPKINFDDCCWSEFKYVHQLQNLYFALTGNELEIKQK